MPIEDNIVDQGEQLDFDPELEHLFYSSELDNCLFDKADYESIQSQIGDQDMWNNHITNECIISFCGGLSRAWKEGR